jgi:ferric-dicitrate binding protein FerR (iron transport regulator)
LPDSSFVNLNAQSQLTFKKNIWDYKRQVHLEGEAFFSVASGARFDVVTPEGTVSVLGTQFNVKNRGDFFEVVCYEGKVQVISDKRRNELTQGQSYRILEGHEQKSDNIQDVSPGWISNQSNFKSVPFSYVMQELELQYGVTVKAENLDLEQLFTGTFEHDNLTLALKSITLPLNLQYQILANDQIILSRQSD